MTDTRSTWSTWGPDDARPGDPDDITKYDHLLTLGQSRMRGFDQQLRVRDDNINRLQQEVENLRESNQRLTDAVAELTSVPPRDEGWRWIDSTYTLQRNVYGHTLPYAPNTNVLADYVQMNALAAVDEIMEMLGEVGWKPWAEPRGWIRPKHVMKEAVDALHFIANVLCAAGISDDEFWEAYRAKQVTNTRRQELGYDGVSGKCPGCKRAYDDGIDCDPPSGTEPAYCTVQDTFIQPEA